MLSRRSAIRPDDLRFHPHVTLGRIKPGRQGDRDLTRLVGALSRLVGRVDSWSRKSPRSHRRSAQAGPIYTPIGRAQLKSKKNRSDSLTGVSIE